MKPLLAAVLLLLAAPALAQGRLAFATTTHDFGEIAEGEEPTYAFSFTNEGDRPLTLRHVRPACGCTTPSFPAEAVLPGATAQIVVAYDSKGRPGVFRKAIYIVADLGNDELAEETLTITGDVKPVALTDGARQGNAVFDAEVHDLGAVPAGRAVRHVFRMQNAGQLPLRITEARSEPEGAEIVFPNGPIFAGHLVEISVVLPGEAVQGDFDYALVLETDDAGQPAKSLRLHGRAQ